MPFVTSLFRYPVKGLGPEPLDSTDLAEGRCLAFDRSLAIAHGNSAFEPRLETWVTPRNFLSRRTCPELATVRARVGEGIVTLARNGSEITVQPDQHDDAAITAFLDSFVSKRHVRPFSLVSGAAALTDEPIAGISILNSESLRDLERAVGATLEPERFRGNVWIDDLEPWFENDLTGAVIRMGDARLRVVQPIKRCVAINVEPSTGATNLNVLKYLTTTFGHPNFGVLAKVEIPGRVGREDQVHFSG
ncbi:MAG: MOSC domain-containing protein [Alphaproteobacteria bacterium]|nr:MOSC domain-containing protein [Alphaproteobacteria bacterium]